MTFESEVLQLLLLLEVVLTCIAPHIENDVITQLVSITRASPPLQWHGHGAVNERREEVRTICTYSFASSNPAPRTSCFCSCQVLQVMVILGDHVGPGIGLRLRLVLESGL